MIRRLFFTQWVTLFAFPMIVTSQTNIEEAFRVESFVKTSSFD